MSDKLPIRLSILEREYPLNIQWSDEERFREAAKRMNDLATKLRQAYPKKDAQDILAMVGLQFASKLLGTEQNLQQNEIGDDIERLCEELDEFIKINQ